MKVQIRGRSPSSVKLKFSLGIQGPQGDTGATGPANSLSIGTVTTGAAGSSASAAITGTAPTQSLSLTIPRGDTGVTGNPGPGNTLSIGTVTTGAAGSSASATITGTSPTQTLNLTIPKGQDGLGLTDGDKGDITVSGTGTAFTIDTDAVTTAKIINDAVTNAKLANMAVNTIKGRVTTGTGDPEDLTAAQARTVIGISTFGATLVDDADAATARTTLGVFWESQIIAPASAVAAVDFAIPAGVTHIRLTGSGIVTVAGGISLRVSTDNGATFKAGATDYMSGNIYLSGATIGNTPSTATGSAVLVSPQVDANFPSVIEATMFKNATTLYVRSHGTGYSVANSAYQLLVGGFGNFSPNFIRLMPSAGGNFAVGTKFHLEMF